MPCEIVTTAAAALEKAGFRSGATVMAGGFGLCGIPEHFIAAIREGGWKDLTFISNNAGVDDFGLGLLLKTRQIVRMISSYVGENAEFERQYLEGDLQLEFVPQGTFAERIRAGGAGIGGFYTPTGVGTMVAAGKEVRVLNDREYVLELGLRADFALIKAWQADTAGNLVYRMTARNFNPMMATAADRVLAEVEQIVPAGGIDPDRVETPGIYVDFLFRGAKYEKRVEQRTNRPKGG
jgi:3-oxoacid CoA-transferase subunit A